MNILITNDDGIYSPGIKVLAEEASKFGKVTIVAPLEEQSACGHGITVRRPIKVIDKSAEFDYPAYAIDGTPADCVKMGKEFLIDGKIDLVLSGINDGPNLGTDVLYSGTVAGAMEGYIEDIDSIAFSIEYPSRNDFKLARKVVYDIIEEKIIAKQEESSLFFNVNIPRIDEKDLKGYRLTKLGQRNYNNEFSKRQDPWGNDYYWLGGEVVSHPLDDLNYDTAAVYNNYVSITPINSNLTNLKFFG